MAQSLSPFKILLSMRDRCRRSAADLPSQKEIKEIWSGIGFSLAGVRLVSPMGQIGEIFKLPSYTHLPGVKHWVLGVSNFRGQLVPLVDLSQFLGIRSSVSLRNRRVVVLQQEDLFVGVVVDTVEGMQHFQVESAFQSIDEDTPEALTPFLAGGYRRDIDDWFVFDFARLLNASAFVDVAA